MPSLLLRAISRNPSPLIALGTALTLVSCAVPNSTDSSGSSVTAANTGSRSVVRPFSMRQKYIGSGTWFSYVKHDTASGGDQAVPAVEETTRENFFAWLLALDDDHPSRSKKKKAAQSTRPAIPATKVHSGVLANSNKANTRIVIDIARQKAFLLVDGKVAIESPVSTARPGKHTPRGSFQISERVRSGKISTIYGVGMPYWMRLSGSAYGVHAGYLPGYPASAGCIRLPSDAAQMIYDNTKYGTRVSIYTNWSGV